MSDIRIGADAVVVSGNDNALTYRPTQVTLDDGAWVAHHSRGGALRTVWAKDLGELFVQVLHFGHGPHGGDLVLHIPELNFVAIGDLYSPEPPVLPVAPSWPGALSRVLMTAGDTSRIVATSGPVSASDLDAFRARLLESAA